MKRLVLTGILLFCANMLEADAPSGAYLQELLEKVRIVRGDQIKSIALEGQPIRCGTEIMFNYWMNNRFLIDAFGKEAAGFADRRDDICYLSVTSPDNHFRIHYNDSVLSEHAVYLVGNDSIGFGEIPGADGIPDYVNKVADIADSVWAFVIDRLGYPVPLTDANNGGDSLLDIYILNLGSAFYGITYPDETAPYTEMSISTYIEIDNDFDIYPYNAGPDGNTLNRRLDAARVTVAHEFFHSLHFSLDRTEYEQQGYYYSLSWWEMTSVWMEEMAFDDINDYYAYLYYFYNYPWIGLRTVSDYSLHQYGAGIFPIYLTEKFDTSIIKDIWERCRDYGTGPQFPQAANDAISSFTTGGQNLLSAFNEFAAWNLFTGTRAEYAPTGYHYTEAEFYDMIPDSCFLTFDEYTDALIWYSQGGWPSDTLNNGTSVVLFKDNMPQLMSAHYLKMGNLSSLQDSSILFIFTAPPGVQWGVSNIGFPYSLPDIASIISFDSSSMGLMLEQVLDPSPFDKIYAVITPVDTAMIDYSLKYGYSLILESSVPSGVLSVDNRIIPGDFSISQNQPNPFNAITTIHYSLPRRSHINIAIYNLLGQKVTTIVNEDKPAGHYETQWNGTDSYGNNVAGGIYFYHFKAGDYCATRKMVYLK